MKTKHPAPIFKAGTRVRIVKEQLVHHTTVFEDGLKKVEELSFAAGTECTVTKVRRRSEGSFKWNSYIIDLGGLGLEMDDDQIVPA